jgi:simple sugar transport system permease protein
MASNAPGKLPLATSFGDLVRGRNRNLQGPLVTLASSLGAVVIALMLSAFILAITGKDPIAAYRKMIDAGFTGDKMLETLQRATPLMIAAVAVAIGFKMNLFNIGVEGQFLMGAFWAAVAGAYVELPAVLHVLFCIVVAMVAGAAWASIAALLKVKRGVNEVITTIMLNSIALSLIDWWFQEFFKVEVKGQLDAKTKILPRTAWMPDLVKDQLTSFILIAIVVVVLFWIVVFKSRFGFRLRASGINAIAARTAGISSQSMIVSSLLISGAVAGLAGLPSLLGNVHAYGPTRPDGYGFKGIAVALLGRNHPIGIVIAALLFGFLDSVAGPLQIAKIPQSIVQVMQAIILITVVIVNEATSRWLNRRTAERTAAALQVAGVAA